MEQLLEQTINTKYIDEAESTSKNKNVTNNNSTKFVCNESIHFAYEPTSMYALCSVRLC